MSDFVPHHALVTAEGGGAPSRWMLVLHGILGSGGNFRTIARRLVAARPEYGFALVDLRHHGQSPGAPPPDTGGAAADDLLRLEARLPGPVTAVMGHSFGGKVALAYADRRAGGAGRAPDPLDVAFVLDAAPGARPGGMNGGEVGAVLAVLESVPWPLPSRERFVELAQEHGLSRPIAEWLATNVRRADDGFRLRLDLGRIQALLEDYFATDLWRVLEEVRGARAFHVVLGGRSASFGPDDRARLEAIAAARPEVTVHELAGAGHWVHADDPEGLLAIVTRALP